MQVLTRRVNRIKSMDACIYLQSSRTRSQCEFRDSYKRYKSQCNPKTLVSVDQSRKPLNKNI